MQLNYGKHKQLPSQVLFTTMTHDNQIKFKPVHCLFKHEIVLPSLKDDWHPGPAHFGIDQFPIGNHNQGEKNVIKSLDSFSIDDVQPIQIPYKNQSRNMLKQYIYFFLILIIRIRLGVENHKTKFPTELICLYFIKLIIRKKTTTSMKKTIPVPLKNLMTLQMKNYN